MRPAGIELTHGPGEISVIILDERDRDGFLGVEVVIEAASQDS